MIGGSCKRKSWRSFLLFAVVLEEDNHFANRRSKGRKESITTYIINAATSKDLLNLRGTIVILDWTKRLQISRAKHLFPRRKLMFHSSAYSGQKKRSVLGEKDRAILEIEIRE